MLKSYDRCEKLTYHFFDPKERPVTILHAEFAKAAIIVQLAVKIPLREHQEEALMCLISDVVGHHVECQHPFAADPLILNLNAGNMQLVQADWMRLVYYRGRVDELLIEKREAERQLFRSNILRLPY